MKNMDTKAHQVFEDMKSGLSERGYDENHLIIDPKDPHCYKVKIDHSNMGAGKESTSILWARYFPEQQFVFVGSTFSDRIPVEKIPFTLAFLNSMNSDSVLQHLTLCPVCHQIDAVAGIYLVRKVLPKEKFQILLSLTESNEFWLYPAIRQIIEDDSVDHLVSMFCKDNPELKKFFGGRL